MAKEMIDALVGTTIGNYIVQRKVGSGAMGSVYLGEHPEIGKRVAIKVLSAHLTQDAHMVERFQIEARAIGILEHPNIVEMYDFGVLPDGRNYYTMEYLQGETLSQRMKRGNFKLRELCAILEQVCDALYVVHEKGIIHRDMKPSNIFLAKKGMRTIVKILDFGIAKIQDTLRRDGELLTSTGAVLGTPVFMSPEQALGQNERISHLSDIYSLGVILYKILTDRFPIDGTSIPEVVTWHLTRDCIPLQTANPMIPAPLAQVVMRCLNKDPSARFESTAHLWEAFSAVCGQMDMEWIIPSSIARDATISPAAGLSAGSGTGSHASVPYSNSFYPPPPPPAAPAHTPAPSYPSFVTYPPLPSEAVSQSVIAGDSFPGQNKGGKFRKAFLALLAISLLAGGGFWWWTKQSGSNDDMTTATAAAPPETPKPSSPQTRSDAADTSGKKPAAPQEPAGKRRRYSLDIKPATAHVQVRIDGKTLPAAGPIKDFEAEDGATVQVSVQADGFIPKEKEFVATPQAPERLTLELEPLPAVKPDAPPAAPSMRSVPSSSPMKGVHADDKPKDLL